MSTRGTARRAMILGAVALVALGGAWWVASHRPARESVTVAAPLAVSPVSTAVPSALTVLAASSPSASAPASVQVVEKVEKPPEPTAAASKTPPLAKKLADEEKRIADLEARVKEAEAAAQAAKSAAAAKPPPIPPPPNPEPDAGVPDDPTHPLRAARERLEPAKRPAHRLSKEDFQFAFDEAQRVLKERPLSPEAKYLETYARGGLAYVAGKDGVASAALVDAFTELRRRRKDSRPIGNFLLRPDGTIGQPNAWQLALGYGDARGEAAGLIERELAANPRNVRALKARAQLRRMQGLGEPQPQ